MSERPTAVLLCPGRGSYGRDELGDLGRTAADSPQLRDVIARADRRRTDRGEPTISELDGAERFRPGLHLAGANAAELIYLSTLAHAERAMADYDVLAVGGNSLGWYTALAVAGVLDAEAGHDLVTTMAELQELAVGGQILTTTLDADWRTDAALVDGIDAALAAVRARGDDHFVTRSIRLGGHEVLAGTEAGVAALLDALPDASVGNRTFPLRLAGHGPFHTPLCGDVAAAARDRLQNLPIRMPRTHLVDGNGNLHTPWSADPAELLHYTTTTQVTTTFDFTACVRTLLREIQPDAVVCLGPGATLRAPVGHVVLAERWRGVATKDELFASELVRLA